MICRFTLLCALLNLFPVSYAISAATSTTKTTPAGSSSISSRSKVDKTNEKSLSLGTGLQYSSNAIEETNAEAVRRLEIKILPAYKLSEFWKLTSLITGEKELTEPGESDLGNIPVVLNYNRFRLFNVISVNNRISAVLPASRVSREDESYRSGVGLGLDLAYGFGTWLPTQLTYKIGITKNFHEFETSRVGTPNISVTLRQDLLLDFSLTEKLKLNLHGAYRKSRTYGDYERDSFIADGELSYALTKELGIYTGTSNEGGALAANGTDSNIRFYDERTSFIYGGISYDY